jgi:hypothetical protein
VAVAASVLLAASLMVVLVLAATRSGPTGPARVAEPITTSSAPAVASADTVSPTTPSYDTGSAPAVTTASVATTATTATSASPCQAEDLSAQLMSSDGGRRPVSWCEQRAGRAG